MTVHSATPLSAEMVDSYWKNGYLVMPHALRGEQLAGLRTDVASWVEESRGHGQPFGETMDGRPRFDLEADHTAEAPALRRVASPVEVSASFLDVMRTAPAVDAVAQLIGPNVEFNNSKVNSKQPGASTHVKFHQDFMFQPHTNEDLIAVLYFVDDVTMENGPLEVVPGSHRGPLFDHWHDEVYTGAVSADVVQAETGASVSAVGPAGTACLMHTRLLHGSGPNLSLLPRTLFIAEYRSEDSKALQVNHLPSIHDGELVRGERTNQVRCSTYEMRYPEVPTGPSFFDQQAKAQS